MIFLTSVEVTGIYNFRLILKEKKVKSYIKIRILRKVFNEQLYQMQKTTPQDNRLEEV